MRHFGFQRKNCSETDGALRRLIQEVDETQANANALSFTAKGGYTQARIICLPINTSFCSKSVHESGADPVLRIGECILNPFS